MKHSSHSYIVTLSCMILFSSCATIPDYKPIVDTSSFVKDGVSQRFDKDKYDKDYQECLEITNSVDYSDEKLFNFPNFTVRCENAISAGKFAGRSCSKKLAWGRNKR